MQKANMRLFMFLECKRESCCFTLLIFALCLLMYYGDGDVVALAVFV